VDGPTGPHPGASKSPAIAAHTVARSMRRTLRRREWLIRRWRPTPVRQGVPTVGTGAAGIGWQRKQTAISLGSRHRRALYGADPSR